MIDYYSLYKNSLEAIGYHKLDTGVDYFNTLLQQKKENDIFSIPLSRS
ncbi:Uncharacterised protein [Streptococcus agalactiae]|nr:Uncharacterised protein [Streptococcus agalactiae]